MYSKQLNTTLILIICILLCQLSFSQNTINCDSTNNKKARIYYNEANSLSLENKPGNISLLRKAIKEDTAFAAPNFLLGKIFYNKTIQAQYDIQQVSHNSYYFKKSEDYFLRAIELCEHIEDYTSFYFLGELYFIHNEYALANYYLNYFLQNSTKNFAGKDKARDYIYKYKLWEDWNKNPHQTSIVPIENICTKSDELLPFITHNGQQLYYTNRYTKTQPNSIYSETVEEFMVSTNIGTDTLNNWQYSIGKLMDWPFNDGRNQGGISLSYDGKNLFITICESLRINNKAFKNCDIYWASKQADFWEPPEKLGNQINANNTWEAQPTLSSDGNTLFFASERPGGFGGSDIYYCQKDSLNNWSKPKNMGNTINTINDEKAPFIHFDNKTFYFSSNGFFGLGGYDVFISKLNESGEWSQPLNLGKPFNTAADEIGFVVDARGTKAYFASNHFPGKGGWDIFSADLPKKLRPTEQYILNGKVIDQNNTPLNQAKISILETKEASKSYSIKNSDGFFSEILPIKSNEFIIRAEATDYSFGCKLVKLSSGSNGSFETIVLTKLHKGATFELEQVYFETDSYALNLKSKILLNYFSSYLKKNLNIHIKILGYTDHIATEEYNQELSEERAKAVYNYLIEHGVTKYRLSYEGFGENNPLTENKNTWQKAKNRRVEIEILKH